jgi:hypothetical protein
MKAVVRLNETEYDAEDPTSCVHHDLEFNDCISLTDTGSMRVMCS